MFKTQSYLPRLEHLHPQTIQTSTTDLRFGKRFMFSNRNFPNESKWTIASTYFSLDGFPFTPCLSLLLYSVCWIGLHLQEWTVVKPQTRSQPCLHRLTKWEHCFVYISPNVQTKKPNQRPCNVVTESQGQIRFHSTDEFHILKHMRAQRNSRTVSEGQERWVAASSVIHSGTAGR